MNVCLQAYGESGVLVTAPEFEDLYLRPLLDLALLERPLVGYVEHIWGAHSLLILFRGAVNADVLVRWFAQFDGSAVTVVSEGRSLELPVIYDGPDLESVAGHLAVSVEEVIQLHSDATYQVRMMGFSPGFPYLDGLDPRLHLPRRESPRTRIEPGSIAIGGPHAGIYSVASPGGWHLLGRTQLRLFKPEEAKGDRVAVADVFALKPGDRVCFVPTEQEVCE